MRLLPLAVGLLLMACSKSPRPPAPAPLLPCEVPEYQEPALPKGLLVCEDCDLSELLRAAWQSGHQGVGIPRGDTLRLTSGVVVRDSQWLAAVGDPSLPRPVLLFDRLDDSAVGIWNRSVLYHLDIRGWRDGQVDYPVATHPDFLDWREKGINAGPRTGWSIIGTSVSGFPGTCLLNSMAEDVLIEGSSFSHCGYSGISLFSHEGYCGSGAVLRDVWVKNNGQNGIDACVSDVLYENVVAVGNGWDHQPGDGHGLLIHAPHMEVRGVNIRGGVFVGNREAGIWAIVMDSLEMNISRSVKGGNGMSGLWAPSTVASEITLCTVGGAR